jgi:hypothetical protein
MVDMGGSAVRNAAGARLASIGWERMFRHVGPMAALLILLASGNAEAAEPAKLRIGWAVMPGQLTALIFAKPDLFAHDGYRRPLARRRGGTA